MSKHYENKTCPQCNGSGKTPFLRFFTIKCDTCRGSGTIRVKVGDPTAVKPARRHHGHDARA